MKTAKLENQYEEVKNYYGKEIQSSSDLKTSACCPLDAIPPHVRGVLPLITDEIHDKYYGCGSPIPLALKGLRVLDLGCGSGRDSYAMSYLVGEDGFVYGIDMTKEQIEVARKHRQPQSEKFGYSQPNTNFILDYMENMHHHFEKASLDLITSNCVINLTSDKELVLSRAYDILKEGGEMYFSDIYADRRIPEELQDHPVLRGECLGGALYINDFRRTARRVGFPDPRMVSKREIEISDPEIKKLLGHVRFCSITFRLFKLKGLEDLCEDYGHIAIYKGGIPEAPFRFDLDRGHGFEKNKPERVCGNTALMLSETRFKEYFQVFGSFEEHFGEFNCGASSQDSSEKISCC